MTPPAATATGGRTLPRTAAPRTPRRVSGPAAKPKRGAPAPPRAAGSAQTRTRPPRSAAPDPFIVRAIERTMRMADSRFLDRLIRGRLWIPLVAVGLMGIVFMQVSMLKLNAGIGRAVQASQTLERQNATMRAQVSGAEAGSKIDATAEQLGMVAPAATTTPSYVTAGGAAQAATAAKQMTAPDPEALARAKAAAQASAAVGATTTQTQTQAPVAQTQQAQTEQTQAPVTQTQTQQTQAPVTQTQAPVTQTQTQQTQQPAPTQVAQTQTPAAQTQAPTQATAQPQQQATTATSTSGGAVAPAAG